MGTKLKRRRGDCKIPRGVSQELQSLPGGCRLGAQGEVPRAKGLAEEGGISKPIGQDILDGSDGSFEIGHIPGSSVFNFRLLWVQPSMRPGAGQFGQSA
jgi:hypothetical protein